MENIFSNILDFFNGFCYNIILKYPDIAEYITANRLYIKFDADIYYNYNCVALDEVINAEAQEMQAEIEKKVDEIITTLELNGGNMETLTQLLHNAAMSL